VLPVYIQVLYGAPHGLIAAAGVVAPDFPRVDLVTALHQGVPGINRPLYQADDDDDDDRHDHHHHDDQHDDDDDDHVVFADLLRLNVTMAPVAFASQSPLGLLHDLTNGYPNGRRIGDDAVDITLRVAMGVLCTVLDGALCGLASAADAPATASLEYTDQAPVRACMFPTSFPYLNPPIPGSELFQPTGPYSESQWFQNCAPYTGFNAFNQ